MPVRKSLEIKKLEGFAGKGAFPNQESKLIALEFKMPNMGTVFVPEHLHQDAQDCIEVIKESMPEGVYSRLDTYGLAAFACAWAVHKRAAFELSNPEFEWVIHSNKGQVPNPWIKIMFEAGNQMAKHSGKLGLDPGSREDLLLPKALGGRQLLGKFNGLIGQNV